MVMTKVVFKGDRYSKAIQFNNNNLVVGGAVSLEDEVQTVSDTMPIHRFLEMILLAFK